MKGLSELIYTVYLARSKCSIKNGREIFNLSFLLDQFFLWETDLPWRNKYFLKTLLLAFCSVRIKSRSSQLGVTLFLCRYFWLLHLGEMGCCWHLAERPGMPLNILQSTGQPPPPAPHHSKGWPSPECQQCHGGETLLWKELPQCHSDFLSSNFRPAPCQGHTQPLHGEPDPTWDQHGAPLIMKGKTMELSEGPETRGVSSFRKYFKIVSAYMSFLSCVKCLGE